LKRDYYILEIVKNHSIFEAIKRNENYSTSNKRRIKTNQLRKK